jgi:hypothetical protein
MSFDAEKMYELLPAIYRIRDTEQGGPLKALIAVIAQQVGILEEDLEQLYDDRFIETCAPWVAPYIGDLIGISGLRSSGLPGLSGMPGLTPRAEVANTISYRRRKGTAAVLQQLAHDITGWPARAVEFFQLLATTQYMNHIRPENSSFIRIRDSQYLGSPPEATGVGVSANRMRPAERLEYLGTPFERLVGQDDLTHNVDVRRIADRRGRYNIPNVGVFLWRLRAYSSSSSPAVPAAPGDQRRFRFSSLGNDIPLFSFPRTLDDPSQLAEPIDVPDRISRRAMNRSPDDYYGDGKSILINRVIGTDPNGNLQFDTVQSSAVKVCNLSDWASAEPGKVSIDPVLGRINFPTPPLSPPGDGRIFVDYYYGFGADLGGGEYEREASFDPEPTDTSKVQLVKVSKSHPQGQDAQGQAWFKTIQGALNAATAATAANGIVEITDNEIYDEALSINVGGNKLELRAADQLRPTIRLSSDFQIDGQKAGHVSINGLLISGHGINVFNGLGGLRISHCTLAPGLSLSEKGAPQSGGAPSLRIAVASIPAVTVLQVEITSSVVGAIRSRADARTKIANSIVDANDETGVAYSGEDENSPGGPVQFVNSTVIGKVYASALELASNTIFLAALSGKEDSTIWPGPMVVQRRQEGCVRFSHLPVGALTPRRFKCQPVFDADAGRVRPVFESLRYADPGYCFLRPDCPVEIRQGADDESEMGVFHDLFQPQRESHLRIRIDEYLRFGLEAGIFYST